jgi:hypothetical protein
MASFNVDITYTITATELSVDESQIAVTYTLYSAAADLTKEYIETYPTSMYFQNADDTMDESDLQTQMRGNFLTLAKSTLEDFAGEAKAIVRQTQGLIGNEDLTGVISLSEETLTIYAGVEPFSFIAKWE